MFKVLQGGIRTSFNKSSAPSSAFIPGLGMIGFSATGALDMMLPVSKTNMPIGILFDDYSEVGAMMKVVGVTGGGGSSSSVHSTGATDLSLTIITGVFIGQVSGSGVVGTFASTDVGKSVSASPATGKIVLTTGDAAPIGTVIEYIGANDIKVLFNFGSQANLPVANRVELFDDFIGKTTTTLTTSAHGFFGTAGGTGGAVTLTTTGDVCGTAKIYSGTSNHDAASISTEISWYGKFNPVFETKLAVDSVANICLNIGFISAIPSNVSAFDLADITWSTTGTNGVMFAYDSEAATAGKFLWAQSVNANTDNVTPVNTGILPALTSAAYQTFRIELIDNGVTVDARFYINGVLVATLLDCVARATALTPVILVATRTGAAKYALVDWAYVAQNRA